MTKPPIHKIGFRETRFRNDPWTTYSQMREEGPVIRIKMPIIGKTWAATTYEAVNEVLRDDERFVRDPVNAGRKNFIKWQWLLPKSMAAMANNMLGADGKRHRRLRSLVDQAFARRNIEGMSARVEFIAQEQLECVEQIARQEGQFDLLEHYARPVPLTVICELLGLPAADHAKFREWFAPFSTVNSVFGILTIGRSIKKLGRYLTDQFHEVQQNPRVGLITELVTAEHEGQQLSDSELLSMAFLLLAAGHETTVHLISNCVLTLLQFPEARDSLQSDWSKCDAVIEEALRYCSPLQMAKPRFVAEDIEFHGQTLRRGEMITPLLASANYDPKKFENPHEFDIDRKSNHHMSFGSGPHTCLGIKLARTETRHAIQCLFERWPSIQPAFDLKQPDWSQRFGARGLKTMYLKTGNG